MLLAALAFERCAELVPRQAYVAKKTMYSSGCANYEYTCTHMAEARVARATRIVEKVHALV